MELNIYNIKGEDTGRVVVLDDSVFAIEPNDHAIYLDVKQYMANKRQGTHKSKERSEISGSTRKLIRQKGGGGARRGDINSPVLVGGGRVFGPKPRNYSFKINTKVKQLARRSALTYKAINKQITVIEDFDFTTPKTKNFISMSKGLGLIDDKNRIKALVVISEPKLSVVLSARNLKDVKVLLASQLNTYNILKYPNLVLTESSLPIINDILKA